MASSIATSGVLSSSTPLSNPSVYTNYVNVHLSIDKLDGTNYATWASDIKLWLKSQGYKDHLIQSVTTVVADEVSRWTKNDAQYALLLSPSLTLR